MFSSLLSSGKEYEIGAISSLNICYNLPKNNLGLGVFIF
jgi:hypothetical protein